MHSVKQLVNNTICGLRKEEDHCLAKALKHWLPFFMNTVKKLNQITHKPQIDIAQDLLLSLVEANIAYNSSLFRYHGKLWEIDFEDGSAVRLKAPRYKTVILGSFWVDRGLIKRVKRAPYNSYLYYMLKQQYLDILKLHYTRKNGYDFEGRKKDRPDVKRVVSEVHTSDLGKTDKRKYFSFFDTDSFSSEEIAEIREFVSILTENVSQDSATVLQYLVKYTDSKTGEISGACKLSKNKVRVCKQELWSSASKILSCDPIYFKNVSPVYLTI